MVLALSACGAEQSEAPVSAQSEPAIEPAPERAEAAPAEAVARQISDSELSVLRQFTNYIGETEKNLDQLHVLLKQAADDIGEDSPLWPVRVFLQAEFLREEGDLVESGKLFRQLALWGKSDPYGDKWGGSSLAVFGLWRWVEALDLNETVDPGELETIFEVDRFLRHDAKLTTRVFRFSFLDSLPQIEEDLARRLALLALNAGLEEKAQAIFVDYLGVATGELGPRESELFELIVSKGWASRERLLTRSALRLQELRRYDDAAEIWRGLLDAKDAYDRAFAGLQLAHIEARRISKDNPRIDISQRIDTVLRDAKDPALVQEALYTRARLWQREGKPQDLSRFCTDMGALLRRYPKGEWADDARFRIAHFAMTRYFDGADHACRDDVEPWDEALEQYSALRDFPGQNDRIDSSYFRPAIMYYSRGEEGDLAQSLSLLEELNQVRPDGPYFRNATFWRARILEEMGESELAREAFDEVIKKQPFDYFGIRARMHLADGPQSNRQLLPGPGLREEIARHYDKYPPFDSLESDSPYHLRLGAVLDSGLYSKAVDERLLLKEVLPKKRLQTIPLATIDSIPGAITTLGLFLAFRQDAAAAADMESLASNHLRIQSVVGRKANDWTLSLALATGEVHPHYSSSDIGAHPRYLSTVYPSTLTDEFTAASQNWSVPPELLYSLSRRESLFDPMAISVADALGLFQFIPWTFKSLNMQWGLLEESGVQNREEFLLNPVLSANLGARWLTDELMARHNRRLLLELGLKVNSANRNNADLVLLPGTEWFSDSLSAKQQRVLMLSLMEHSAGYPNVRFWLNRWNKQGRSEDFEYMLTTADAAETRILVRSVVTDSVIAASIGLFANEGL